MYVRVSPEYVFLVGLNDGDGVIYSVTPAVEFTDVPSVSGGAEAQQPLGIIANSRRKELPEIDVVELVVCNYCGVEQAFWKQIIRINGIWRGAVAISYLDNNKRMEVVILVKVSLENSVFNFNFLKNLVNI